ncbi:MAG: hypothetical protein MH252_00880 [Thermosynechococcaceae cyanobacterium MS004]|nr:hypothetical protein [Thermosynechococcaceae cyanobacterium MS004]
MLHCSSRLAKFPQRPYRCLLIAAILLGGNLWSGKAIAASPAPGLVIENQATGSYIDAADGQSKTVTSDIVRITVAEVAGITVTAANLPSQPLPGGTVNFDFTITNVGNDPTQFFIPGAPSSISGGTAGNLQLIAYDADGSGATAPVDLTSNNITVPAGGRATGGVGGLLTSLATANNGSIPAGATLIVRIPTTATGAGGDTVSATLGKTTPANAQNQPYVADGNDLYTLDNSDGAPGEAPGSPINGDTTNRRQEASATQSVTVRLVTGISGLVFNDADASVTINDSDAGTDAGSATLTVYAIDTAGLVVAKASVATNGTYNLANLPQNTSLKLRLSNDASIAVGATAPIAPSLPTGWFHTGENLNGTIDGAIATLGDIALTTTTASLSQHNFGIRQSYVLPAAPAPATCAANFTTTLNTGVSASGELLLSGSNDLNWTAEWLPGPASGLYTPYATPRPVGVMPAVVVGKLAGTWVDSPSSVQWISYPFRLSSNRNGNHQDANLNGTNNQENDTVRLKFTAKVTLPSNAASIAISLPVGVSADNQFVSLKVNGVENLVPTPAQNAYIQDFRSIRSTNIQNGWQPGVNTIEVIVDSGPPLTGFFLGVQATTTQICTNPNVLLVKRITAINGDTTTLEGDNLAIYNQDDAYPYDDNLLEPSLAPSPAFPGADTDKWPATTAKTSSSFLIGGRIGGKTKPNDEVEYTIYFLSAGTSPAKNVTLCDRIPAHQTFVPDAFNNVTPAPSTATPTPSGDRGILVSQGGIAYAHTNIGDGDAARYYPPGSTLPSACTQPLTGEDNGTIVVNLGEVPNATAPGTPADSYGFIRLRAKVK